MVQGECSDYDEVSGVFLTKGCEVPARRYRRADASIFRGETGLGVLQYRGTPLTNNEAERCIRGSDHAEDPGTTSDLGKNFPAPGCYQY